MIESWVVVGIDDTSDDSLSGASSSLASDYEFGSDVEDMAMTTLPSPTRSDVI